MDLPARLPVPGKDCWNFTTTQFACDDQEYERGALDVEERR